VVVLGVAESLEHLSYQDLASSGIRLAMGLHDGPVELAVKAPQHPYRRRGRPGAARQRSTTVNHGAQRTTILAGRQP
jgi:hypothetical protein